jgi:hypothetical protein
LWVGREREREREREKLEAKNAKLLLGCTEKEATNK